MAKNMSIGVVGGGKTVRAPTVKAKPTNWLAPMSAKQLRQQAVKTISSSYTPSYKNLNQQQQRASAIYNKQVRDNKAFENWYAGQAATLTNANNAANQALSGAMQQATANANAAYAPQAGNLIAAADAREGNVSNNAMAAPYGQQLTDSQNVDRAVTGSSETAALQTANTGGNVLAATNSNNEGRVQEGQQKQLSSYQTVLNNIAQQRTKLQSSQTGDISKEIARLQGVEVQKAQAQENYNAAVQKLGLTAQDDQTRNAISEQNANTAATRANNEAAQYKTEDALRKAQIQAGLTENQWRAMQASKNYQLAARKVGDQEATTRYLQEHHLGTYAPKTAAGTPGQPKFGTTTEQNEIADTVDRIKGELNFAIDDMGYSPQAALNMIIRGGSYSYTDSTTKKTTKRSFSSEGRTPEVQAAYDLVNGNGLTPKDIQALNKLGLKVGNRYLRAPKQVNPPATRGRQQAR